MPIVVSSASQATGSTFKAYWRAIGERIGPFITKTSSATATGFEAESLVWCASFADDDEKPERFLRAFLYVTMGAQAGQQKRLRADGFEPWSGLMKVSAPFSAALASGSEFDLSLPLPVDTFGSYPSLKKIAKAALDALPLHHDLDVTYEQDAVRYSIANLPWTVRREHILDIYPPISSGSTASETRPTPISRGAWDVEYDGDGPFIVLRTGFNDGETFFVKVRRPASSWVKTSSWGDSTTGPTDDAHECLYDVDTVANLGVKIAYERLETYWREHGDNERADRYGKALVRASGPALAARLRQAFRTTGVQRVGAR